MIFLNIGSNLNSTKGNRIFNLNESLDLIRLENIKIIKVSSIYETPSYPNKKNPKFLNIGLQIECNYSPKQLIKIFNKIEKQLQRIRGKKNEPRTCDIDLIDYDRKVILSKNLSIPHPKAHLRNFVLYPILQIDAEWVHPKIQKNVKVLINNLDQKSRIEITRLNKNVIINT